MILTIMGCEERTEKSQKPQFEIFIDGDSKGKFHSIELEIEGKDSYIITGIDRE